MVIKVKQIRMLQSLRHTRGGDCVVAVHTNRFRVLPAPASAACLWSKKPLTGNVFLPQPYHLWYITWRMLL